MRKKLLNTNEVAKMLNMSAATLISWRSKGQATLKFYKLGRRVLYDESDIVVWLKTRETTVTKPVKYF